MFNNIIYFIIVLLIFNISYPEKAPTGTFLFSLMMFVFCWIIFAGYCRLSFQQLANRNIEYSDSSLTNSYHNLVFRLSILAILLFGINIFVFHLKYWLNQIPGIEHFTVLQGVFALMFFFFYLGTIWYFSYPAYNRIFQVRLGRRSYILSNVRFNAPILFPWFFLSLLYDLLAFVPWSGPKLFLDKPVGQIIFFVVFLSILMVFLPHIIQSWWGCKPFETSDQVIELKDFLNKLGLRYRALLRWPIFEGRMMTAGIMGIIPRFRYILVTDSLMETLNIPELKAVMAHEAGHAKYKHLIYYVIFFLGYMLLFMGSIDIFFVFIVSHPLFQNLMGGEEAQSANLFYFILSVPILITMFVYFRYIMGFFMRNFERQADGYSARTMGTPEPTISALEKIAFLSGKSRDIPSWHHFSIRERVEYLRKTAEEPGLIKQHNKFVVTSFVTFLVFTIGLGYLLNFSPIKQDINNRLVKNLINRELTKDPKNILLLENLAFIYREMGRFEDEIDTYERLLSIDNSQPVALNNLAWLLVTTPEESMREPVRGLELAKRAVELQRIPTFLDTLAEAYFVNGFKQKAIESIKEAILLEKGDKTYFKNQLEKFSKGLSE
jgi:Zn-dependent protease with chaperone function